MYVVNSLLLEQPRNLVVSKLSYCDLFYSNMSTYVRSALPGTGTHSFDSFTLLELKRFEVSMSREVFPGRTG